MAMVFPWVVGHPVLGLQGDRYGAHRAQQAAPLHGINAIPGALIATQHVGALLAAPPIAAPRPLLEPQRLGPARSGLAH